MHVMINRLVQQDFMTKGEGQYIQNAIDRKDSFIVSGHRSAGTRTLMASLMAIAKSNFSSVQVKEFDDLDKPVEYFLIPGIANIDFEKLIGDAMGKENTSLISIKDPDHPYSIMKLLRGNFKLNNDISKIYQVLECDKFDDIPKLAKITKMKLNEKGRLEKEDFQE